MNLSGNRNDSTRKLNNNFQPPSSNITLSGNSNLPNEFTPETDPIFTAWDKSTGIVIDQSQIDPPISIDSSQISDGAGLVNLQDWTIEEEVEDILFKRNGNTRTRISKDGELNSGGIVFNYCLVRNSTLDNTLALDDDTNLIITDIVGQVVYVNRLPNYSGFDKTGWIAMLSDEDKTNSIDPTVSGDYLYRTNCVVDRITKTLTFDGGYDLGQWEIGDTIVLYNPFINYDFVGDQTANPLVSITGAPAWRNKLSGNGCMFRHSDGRFIWMFLGYANADGVGRIGYSYSTDMVSWTVGNSDNWVYQPSSIPDTTYFALTGSCYPLNDGTGRYYILLSTTLTSDSHGALRILYFDEDLTTFTFSAILIPDLQLGTYGGSVLKIGDYYHLMYIVLHAAGYEYRYIEVAKSLYLEGPYVNYQTILSGITSNDGVAWSGISDAPTMFNDGVKIFATFGAQAQWSRSGTKGNRMYCLLDFDSVTEVWSANKLGPIIINPTYFNNIYGDYNWCSDHCGGYPAFFINGEDAYMTSTMKGAVYQSAILKLKYTGGKLSNYVPYEGAEKDIDLNTRNITTSGTITADNLTGDNTGDQNLSVLVPYTGATGDVDLGAHTISVKSITIDDAPINNTDGATVGYVNAAIALGSLWVKAVKDIVSVLPGVPTLGDRYILSVDDHINEWDGGAWISTHPANGTTLFVEGDIAAPTNYVGNYNYNGTAWVYVGGVINHNDTTNKQGGSAGEYYHLSSATKTSTDILTTTASEIVPTGLTCTGTGSVTGSDGTVSTYVTLTWDAIVTSTFDRYKVRFKKASNTYYNYIETTTNTITIDNLVSNVIYNFGVCSINKYGTESAFCANISQTTAQDTTPPTDVTIGSASAGIKLVVIRWTHVVDKDLSTYNIYRHTTNNSAAASLVSTSSANYFIDTTGTVGTLYYYWVKAVDTSGNLSVNFSGEVHATSRDIVSADNNIAMLGWSQTCVFTPVDADTVSWTAGIFTASNGTSYNISSGNTGNMGAATFIYLNISVSTTAYQTTTSSSTAVGDSKVLIGICEPGTKEASFQLFGGIGGVNIDGSRIVKESITANEIAANTITAGLIKAGTITATEIDTTTITSLNNLLIAASQIQISGLVTLTNWQHPSDATFIDGGKIYASSITTSQLNFTPITGTTVIASINASTEGIKIDADNITISGSTTFSTGYNPYLKVDNLGGQYNTASSGARVKIFPDANTGIEAVDNAGGNIFKIMVGGVDVGDLFIGSSTSGIHYDKSLDTTSFTGVSSFSTARDGLGQGISIVGGQIWENEFLGDSSTLFINNWSYGASTNYFRNTSIGDGRGNSIISTVGSTRSAVIARQLGVGSNLSSICSVDFSDGRNANGDKAFMKIPCLTAAEIATLGAPSAGMMVYNTTTNHFYACGAGAAWVLLL